MNSNEDREALRQRLRARIRDKRDGGGNDRNGTAQLARRMRDDPATAMLELGLDDPAVLSNAKSIARNPHGFLQTAMARPSPAAPDADDDDEAPPPAE